MDNLSGLFDVTVYVLTHIFYCYFFVFVKVQLLSIFKRLTENYPSLTYTVYLPFRLFLTFFLVDENVILSFLQPLAQRINALIAT